MAADNTVLTTIVSENPIRFVFDAPEAALLKYRRAGKDQATVVDIRLQDETEYRWKGRLDFLDNALDRSSGTMRARATVANPDGFIAPGMFGHLRLYAARPFDALMVPDESIVTDQTRQVVYVIGPEDTIAQKVVQPGRLLGGLRVIRSGLEAGDRVVISGVQRARPGRKVAVTQGTVTAFPVGRFAGRDQHAEDSAGRSGRNLGAARAGRQEVAVRLSHFFIERPIFAAAVSVVITLVGVISYFTLPVDQYPNIAPPTVSVNAVYPGATAEEIAETVAAPLEQQINGISGMLYMSSSSTGEGRMTITVTFKTGINVDIAQVEVQNRIQSVLPQLPQEVRDLGITVRKGSTETLLIVHMFATDPSVDRKYIANYASLQVRERLLRTPGVGDVTTNAARDYAMRVWIDPERAAARDLTVQEIVTALRNSNLQVAGGAIGAPPFNNEPGGLPAECARAGAPGIAGGVRRCHHQA